MDIDTDINTDVNIDVSNNVADSDPYLRTKLQSSGSHRCKYRVRVNTATGDFVNYQFIKLFGLATFGVAEDLNHVKQLEATANITVNDETGRPQGVAELEGHCDKGNFQLRANLRHYNNQDSRLHGTATFLLRNSSDNNNINSSILSLQQADYTDGRCIVSLHLSYYGASLAFSDVCYFYLTPTDLPAVWQVVDDCNSHIDVDHLLKLYPELLTGDWRAKMVTAKKLFNGITLE